MTVTITLPPIFICANWSDEVRMDEEKKDAVFVSLSRPEWEEEKRRAKSEKRFRSWDDWLGWVSRIDDKRRQLRMPAAVLPEPTQLQILMSLRDEYVNMPAMHFATEKSRDRELKKLEKEIIACVGGADALYRAQIRECDETETETNTTVSEESDDDSIDMSLFVRTK